MTTLFSQLIYGIENGIGSISELTISKRSDGGLSYSSKPYHSIKLSRRAFVIQNVGTSRVLETFSDRNDLVDCLRDINSPVAEKEIQFVNLSYETIIKAVFNLHDQNITIKENCSLLELSEIIKAHIPELEHIFVGDIL